MRFGDFFLTLCLFIYFPCKSHSTINKLQLNGDQPPADGRFKKKKLVFVTTHLLYARTWPLSQSQSDDSFSKRTAVSLARLNFCLKWQHSTNWRSFNNSPTG